MDMVQIGALVLLGRLVEASSQSTHPIARFLKGITPLTQKLCFLTPMGCTLYMLGICCKNFVQIGCSWAEQSAVMWYHVHLLSLSNQRHMAPIPIPLQGQHTSRDVRQWRSGALIDSGPPASLWRHCWQGTSQVFPPPLSAAGWWVEAKQRPFHT